MPEAVLALGSNLGDSQATLQGAVDSLTAAPDVTVIAVSPVFETDPVGGPEQGAYLNAVVIVDTDLDGPALLALTQGIEQEWHRVRDARWGPRTLDVDIIAMGDAVIDAPDLVVPHPRAHERGFVLVPWAAIAPDATIPGRGRVDGLLPMVDTTGVRRTDLVLAVGEH